MINPYKDFEKGNSCVERTFSQSVNDHELVWHRDLEDRLVEAVTPTDWLVQLDNELPQPLTQIFIPKGVYHRTIKGTGDLVIRIYKK